MGGVGKARAEGLEIDRIFHEAIKRVANTKSWRELPRFRLGLKSFGPWGMGALPETITKVS